MICLTAAASLVRSSVRACELAAREALAVHGVMICDDRGEIGPVDIDAVDAGAALVHPIGR
jgi:hypothetical protein